MEARTLWKIGAAALVLTLVGCSGGGEECQTGDCPPPVECGNVAVPEAWIGQYVGEQVYLDCESGEVLGQEYYDHSICAGEPPVELAGDDIVVECDVEINGDSYSAYYVIEGRPTDDCVVRRTIEVSGQFAGDELTISGRIDVVTTGPCLEPTSCADIQITATRVGPPVDCPEAPASTNPMAPF